MAKTITYRQKFSNSPIKGSDLNQIKQVVNTMSPLVFRKNPDFLVEGGTVNYRDIGFIKIVEFESVNEFTLPQISSLSDTDFFIKFKNVSGGEITFNTNATDSIEGETSITLQDSETLECYFYSSTEFKY